MPFSQLFPMAPNTGDELEYLKSLLGRLQVKIEDLEKKAKSAAPPPAKSNKELRMILVGPPGAGKNLSYIIHI
jgi:adenylate kinase